MHQDFSEQIGHTDLVEMGKFNNFADWLEIMKADAGLGDVTVQYSAVRTVQYGSTARFYR